MRGSEASIALLSTMQEKSATTCKISLVSQEKLASKCIRIASTDILN